MVEKQQPCELESSSMLEAAQRGANVPSEVVSEVVAKKRLERSQRTTSSTAEAPRPHHSPASGALGDALAEPASWEGALDGADDDSKERLKQRRFFAERQRLQVIKNVTGRTSESSNALRNSPPSAVGILQDLSGADEEGEAIGSMRNQRRMRAWRARSEKALVDKAKEECALQFQHAKKCSRKMRCADHRTARKASSIGNIDASFDAVAVAVAVC